MSTLNKIDILFVGAGPASLAGAIKLKQLLNEKGRSDSVVVVEKADRMGQHNLSGAIFEADVLDEIVADWRSSKANFVTKMLASKVKRDEAFFLLGSGMAIRFPKIFTPSPMKHRENYIVSICEMVGWMAEIAQSLGVEIYTGFAAKELVIEDGWVKGVRLGDKGLDKEKGQQSNYLPGEVIEAKVTVLGEGSLGLLSEQLVKGFHLDNGRNPQVYALGVKEIIELPKENAFGANRVIHTLGFPNKLLTPDVFGGGALYSMGGNTIAVSLILALDWRYCDLNPHQELQLFKSHSFIKGLIKGGKVTSYGAKTLPEGGYYALPELATNGAMLIGDAAGFTDARNRKGLHYAIKSGVIAAEAIFDAVKQNSFSKSTLKKYEGLLAKSFIIKDLVAVKNFRQLFAKVGRAGIYAGVPLSFLEQLIPYKLGIKPDHKGMTRAKLGRKYSGEIDRLTDASLSGTHHREDQPSHITFINPAECTPCGEQYGCHPCQSFCPAEVYRFEGDHLVLSPSNCLHCQTCQIKCPLQNIRWELPEGGDGPKYKAM